MLRKIIVNNLAILEDIEVEFKVNMTVLTGQTGAGKSLIIDAIGLLLGARADTDMIRYGEKEAIVIGEFDKLSKALLELLKATGIKVTDTLTVMRKLSNTGKNVIKVNDESITLNQLKQIGLYLGDIHVQHDIYRLINKDNYLSFLDNYQDVKFVSLFKDYQIQKMHYQDALKKYQDALKKNKDIEAKLDYLLYQKDELEALELTKDLDLNLANEIEKLSNYDKIYQNLNEAYESLNSENFNLDYLYDAASNLEKVASFDEEYASGSSVLKDAYYQIEEVKSYLYKAKDQLDFDPVYLDNLNEKLYQINKMKEKYHKSNNELIDYLAEISLELSLITNFDEAIKELKNAVNKAYDKLVDISKKLRSYREKEAIKVSKALVRECSDLDLNNTIFEIAFNEIAFDNPLDSTIFKEDGVDEVDFLVSFNVGEPAKPLSKVASGGELSRIMLAFKIIYLANHPLSFMVFDEIDSGISGVTASKIAKKLYAIARDIQVLAITHLAQVAAISDHHLLIQKALVNERTKTLIKAISGDERIAEIAIMLSGMEINSAVLSTAKAMLEAFGSK